MSLDTVRSITFVVVGSHIQWTPSYFVGWICGWCLLTQRVLYLETIKLVCLYSPNRYIYRVGLGRTVYIYYIIFSYCSVLSCQISRRVLFLSTRSCVWYRVWNRRVSDTQTHTHTCVHIYESVVVPCGQLRPKERTHYSTGSCLRNTKVGQKGLRLCHGPCLISSYL